MPKTKACDYRKLGPCVTGFCEGVAVPFRRLERHSADGYRTLDSKELVLVACKDGRGGSAERSLLGHFQNALAITLRIRAQLSRFRC